MSIDGREFTEVVTRFDLGEAHLMTGRRIIDDLDRPACDEIDVTVIAADFDDDLVGGAFALTTLPLKLA